MARFGAPAVYDLADQFRERCLTTGHSLLWPDDRVWTPENIAALRSGFESQVDTAGGFYEAWRIQIQDLPADVHRVAFDSLVLYLLPIAGPAKPETKIRRIEQVLQWKPGLDPPDLITIKSAFFDRVSHGYAGMLPGLMNLGQSYATQMRFQLSFILDFATRVQTEGADPNDWEQCSILADDAKMQTIKGQEMKCSSARNALLHLLFPDRFERIASNQHKRKIAEAFRDRSGDATDLDQAILNIRRSFEAERPSEQIDFYSTKDIHESWSGQTSPDLPIPTNLDAIADLLDQRSLSDPDTTTRQGWRESVRPVTRPFLEAVHAALVGRPGKFYTPGIRRVDKRESFDRLFISLPYQGSGTLEAFVAIGRADESASHPNLERTLCWGISAWGYKNGVPEAVQLESVHGFTVREIDMSQATGFAGSQAVGVRWLTPDDLRKRDPAELAGEIAQTLEDIVGRSTVPTPEVSSMFDELSALTHLDANELRTIESLLSDKQQLILEGPPGSGKTFVAKLFARYFAGLPLDNSDDPHVTIVQFHQSYGYEDFIEGIRAHTEAGQIDYSVEPGIFRRICDRAGQASDERFIVIIDEINRGNIARIFGELLLLLEYRDEQAILPYSHEPFRIPLNVFIIGTMNTADRSLAQIDYALRRRFYFHRLLPVVNGDAPVLRAWLTANNISGGERLVKLFIRLNEAIRRHLDEHHQVGHSYFMRPDIGERRVEDQVWNSGIVPLLEEYFYNERDRASLMEEFGRERLLQSAPPSTDVEGQPAND